jgi:cytochrome c biogenesis protein CcdA
MKRSLIVSFIFVLFLISFVSAQTDILYFHGDGCPHCADVEASGVLERVGALDNVSLLEYEIWYNDSSRDLFIRFMEDFGIARDDWGVPFVVVSNQGEDSYIMGIDMIEDLENLVLTGQGGSSGGQRVGAGDVTLGAVIVAALIDSINPCAFGVLIFLMISLLNLGSSKRALKAGLFYSLVVFMVYFLAGLGLFKIIQGLSAIRGAIYLVVGVIVLLLGLVEFRDYLSARKGGEAFLKISSKIKPFVEKKAREGTLIAILVLGIVVALFELPCTGGIYLGIISLLSEHSAMAWIYLLIYNLIFVLPLVVLTLLIYKGYSAEKLQKWVQGERAWMRLGASIVLLVLGGWLVWIGL